MGRLITASGKSVLISNAGNPILNGIFLVQNDLINGRKWYKRGNNLAIAWSTVDSLWVIYIIGSPAILHYSISAAQNPWDTSWDDVGIVTQAINLSDKKISIKKQNLGGGKLLLRNPKNYDLFFNFGPDGGIVLITLNENEFQSLNRVSNNEGVFSKNFTQITQNQFAEPNVNIIDISYEEDGWYVVFRNQQQNKWTFYQTTNQSFLETIKNNNWNYYANDPAYNNRFNFLAVQYIKNY